MSAPGGVVRSTSDASLQLVLKTLEARELQNLLSTKGERDAFGQREGRQLTRHATDDGWDDIVGTRAFSRTIWWPNARSCSSGVAEATKRRMSYRSGSPPGRWQPAASTGTLRTASPLAKPSATNVTETLIFRRSFFTPKPNQGLWAIAAIIDASEGMALVGRGFGEAKKQCSHAPQDIPPSEE